MPYGFDLTTPHGRMMATIIAGIADFEREYGATIWMRSEGACFCERSTF